MQDQMLQYIHRANQNAMQLHCMLSTCLSIMNSAHCKFGQQHTGVHNAQVAQ